MVQRLKFFGEQWAWFVVRRQVRLIRKFWIGLSLLNQIGIVLFEFRSFAGPCWIPPLHTSSLTPSHHVYLRRRRNGGYGRKVRTSRCPSYRQPELKSSTGPHPFSAINRLLSEGTSFPFTIALSRQNQFWPNHVIIIETIIFSITKISLFY